MTQTSAHELTARLHELLGRERRVLVEFLLGLAEFDRQRLYLELGFRSLWDYVRRALGQSETMTHYRIAAARVVDRFPQVVEPLRQGKLCLTTLAMLASVLTESNCDQVLAEATGKPKQEVQRIKARLDPKPVPRDAMRTLPLLVPAQVRATARVQTEVLTAELTRRHLTTDREFEQLLTRARSALSHKLPHASELDLLKEGLRCILRHYDQRKGMTERPRPRKPAAPPAAAIPRSVKRTVWQRDQGRCQWPTADGSICASTTRVQFHHRIDRGKGGPNTEDNLVLTCAVHNQYAADQSWGREHMERFRGTGRTRTSSDGSAPSLRAAAAAVAAPPPTNSSG